MAIIMYGAAWCGDCKRAEFFFKQNNIPFEYHDIDKEAGAIDIVRKYNNYKQDSIPVVAFDDGSFLIEPTYEELQEKLNL